MGQIQHGIYDAVDDIDPDLLHRYYGAAEGPSNDAEARPLPSNSDSEMNHSDGSTSSEDMESGDESSSNSETDDSDGSTSSEDTESGDESNPNPGDDTSQNTDGDLLDGLEAGWAGRWRDIAHVIAAAQGRNVRHEAAEVARSAIPFIDEDEGEAFRQVLGDALSSEGHPEGFHLNDEYEPSESYRTGRSTRSLVIPLPHEIWFPRITVWCKALDLLKRLELVRGHAV